MKFVPVDEIPKQRTKTFKKTGGEHLQKFMSMGVKYARMDIDHSDYAHPYSACAATKKIIKYWDLPIKVRFVNQEIYLIRTDMEEV
jgi:hypothetical protein